MEHLDAVINTLTHHTKNVPGLKDIAKTAGVSTGHVSLGLILFLSLFMFLGIGADLITDLIGMFYPMYMSFKALETKGGDDDKLWLTYWVVFALYKVVDDWAGVFLYWVPFYYVIKLGILIWLFAPQTKGAISLYDGLIRPFILKHQNEIDQGMTKLGEVASVASSLAKEEAIKKGGEYLLSAHQAK